MDTWPKWDIKNSLPISGSLYPNPEYIQPKMKMNAKVEATKSQPIVSEFPDGPTLLDPPTIKSFTKAKPLLVPEATNLQFITGLDSQSLNILSPLDWASESKVPKSNVLQSSKIHLLSAADQSTSLNKVKDTESDISFDMSNALAGIQGFRPDTTVIKQQTKLITDIPIRITKHFIIMGGKLFFLIKLLIKGIGTGVGIFIGLIAIALKQFNIWPFNKERKIKKSQSIIFKIEKTPYKQKVYRSHARSWIPINN